MIAISIRGQSRRKETYRWVLATMEESHTLLTQLFFTAITHASLKQSMTKQAILLNAPPRLCKISSFVFALEISMVPPVFWKLLFIAILSSSGLTSAIVVAKIQNFMSIASQGMILVFLWRRMESSNSDIEPSARLHIGPRRKSILQIYFK